MLKSIIYKKYLGYDEKTKLYSYLYDLEDTELTGKFEIVSSARSQRCVIAEGAWIVSTVRAIIKFYSQRNLNVSINLALFFGKYVSRLTRSTDKYYQWCKKYIPDIKTYQEEIEKFLLLQ